MNTCSLHLFKHYKIKRSMIVGIIRFCYHCDGIVKLSLFDITINMWRLFDVTASKYNKIFNLQYVKYFLMFLIKCAWCINLNAVKITS